MQTPDLKKKKTKGSLRFKKKKNSKEKKREEKKKTEGTPRKESN